jgi:DNA processing protein
VQRWWATASASPKPPRPLADQNELPDWLRLTLVPGIGSERQRQLLAALGAPARIFAAGRAAVAGVIGTALADRLLDTDTREAITAALSWAREPGNSILCLGEPAYPPALLDIHDPPVLLYVKGDPARLSAPSLAIVGARSATPQGMANASAFARSLSKTGLAIVSGLALGIDAAAHEGALDGCGGTIAVIGTGADRIYPARNQALARRIANAGVIVSEFPIGTPPAAHNFPRRNRLIAGLAQGVLVVEAALGSGSLITAKLAAEQGREVFAVPGSIHSPLSKGCHRLLRDGAKLVETAEDILEELSPRFCHDAAQQPEALPDAASSDSAAFRVLAALGHDPADGDTLALRCGLTADALYAILLPMELDGQVARLPGGRFQRL